jgi:S1-C subfamily serine protease
MKIYIFVIVAIFLSNLNIVKADVFDDVKKIFNDKSIPLCYSKVYSSRCSINYDNGDKYIGEWDGTYLSGQGYYVWKNGEVYQGKWKFTKRHGEGVNYFIDGSIARGSFIDDTFTGFGTRKYVNGDSATGDFKKYLLDGFATYTFANGEKHIGHFKDNKQNGKITIIYPSGEEVQVLYEDGKIKNTSNYSNSKKILNGVSASNKIICKDEDDEWNNCFGKHIYKQEGFVGDLYEGEWKNNDPHGYGTYTYGKDSEYAGDKYIGEYKDGNRHGKGKYIYNSGETYEGEFKDGYSHGQGTQKFTNGDTYVGQWKKDLMEGQGRYSWSNGDVYTGEHVNGLANGYGKFVKVGKDGFVYSGEYKEDKMHGQGKITYNDGRVFQGLFQDDKFQGSVISNYKKEERSTKAKKAEEKLIPMAIGSAFFINKEGYAITNNHVIDGECQKIHGVIKEKKFIFDIIATDENNDIAILRSQKRENHSFLRISEEVNLGEEVIVGGFPLSEGIQNYNIKITKGIVSAVSGVNNNFSEIQIDAAIQGGNSGGPVVNSRGQLIAVTTYKIHATPEEAKKGISIANMNFGKKSSLVSEMLTSKEISYNQFDIFGIFKKSPKNTVGVAKLLSNTTTQIYCLNSKSDWAEVYKQQENTKD